MKGIMKNVIVLLIISNSIIYAEDFDFRKTNWDMSKNDVKKSESLEILAESEEMIIYETKLLGKNVKLSYSFTEDKLTDASYTFGLSIEGAEEEENYNGTYREYFINTYIDFKKALTKKYGEPHYEVPKINNMLLNSLWKIGKLRILLSIKEVSVGSTVSYICQILYTNKEQVEFEIKKRDLEKKKLEDYIIDNF